MAGRYRTLYYNLNKYLFRYLPDNLYHNLLGWIMHKRFRVKYHWMNISNPKTFSEKLQWLKTNGDLKFKTQLADKYDVRSYVRDRIGEKYLIDLIPLNSTGVEVVTSVDDIDWEFLPNQFALKLTKGSGFNIICNDKSKLDKESSIKKLKKWLNIDNYYLSRESQYRGDNKIIAETLLEYNIKDYKFFCFDGNPFMFKVDINRFSGHRANYYHIDGTLIELDEGGCPRDPKIAFQPPENFAEMVEIAKVLSLGWPFVRVDLYTHQGKVYFGEITFHPAGGYAPLSPYEWEYKLGEMIKI